jgi:ectoine hydroxylase-related dioxygenase (phytanoyl-CoA dioxygenase family)
MNRYVDDATRDQFRESGATVVRGALSDWVETLRRGVAFNMDHPSPDGHIYRKEGDGQGRFLSDYCSWRRIPEYRDFIFNSPVAAIGAELMQSSVVQLFHEHVLVKEERTDIPTPWHQDQPYYCVDAPKTVSLWIPLDVVPRETTLEFVAGSHRWGKFYRPQRFNGQALNENDGLESIPDINGNRNAFDILGWDVEPGDAVAFDYRTLHGAPANNSVMRQRRAFSLRLVGEGATFARREGLKTSPPFKQVTLGHGEALRGEDFPILIQ